MCLRSTLLFLTLVLWLSFSVHAAPLHELENLPESSQSLETEVQQPDILEQKRMVITPTAISQKEKREISYFYPYNQSFSLRLIFLADLKKFKGDLDIPYGLGMAYLVSRKRQPQWEVGLDLFSNSVGYIHGGLRWVSFSDNYFRPYYKLGLAHSWQVNEKLVSLINWKNYFFKAAVGLEDVIKLPISIRLEIELGVGVKERFVLLSLGYSWAW